MKKSRVLIAALLGTKMIEALTLWGCGNSGTSSYDVSATPQPSVALVIASNDVVATPEDVKAWIDAGLININSANTAVNKQKLVILSVTDVTNYLAGHIPGAQLLNSGTEINQTRLEGVAQIGAQTVDGTIIDPIIKRSGIDANTAIVFAVNKGGSFLNAARAYYTFRYWGFPKERL